MSDEKFEKWWRDDCSHFGYGAASEAWQASKQAHANEWQPIETVPLNTVVEVYRHDAGWESLTINKIITFTVAATGYTHWRYHNPPPKPKKAWEKAFEKWPLVETSGLTPVRRVAGVDMGCDTFREIFNMGREAK